MLNKALCRGRVDGKETIVLIIFKKTIFFRLTIVSCFASFSLPRPHCMKKIKIS
jgi:hypothetical protein